MQCGKFMYAERCLAVKKGKRNGAVTLVEILVVAAIIAMIAAIFMPALIKARQQSRRTLNMNNQHQIVAAVTCFASDNNGRYPESVATIGQGENWNWQEPTMMTAVRSRNPQLHRSMGRYLHSYIESAKTLFCPAAPHKYRYLQAAWDAGDEWDNPETPAAQDPVMGTYCFYWNYLGILEEQKKLFKGPEGLSGGREQSKVLISDYFGYNHWRSPLLYGSCEKPKGAIVTSGTAVSSDYWSCPKTGTSDIDLHKIKLYAGYMDGHVESYSATETVPMKVSMSTDGSMPYPDEPGPGVFYLPADALP